MRASLLTISLLAISIASCATGFLIGGRYAVAPISPGAVVVDRFTGSVRFCTAGDCHPVYDKDEWGPPINPVAK
jgi:hypothetical protein